MQFQKALGKIENTDKRHEIEEIMKELKKDVREEKSEARKKEKARRNARKRSAFLEGTNTHMIKRSDAFSNDTISNDTVDIRMEKETIF
jgi:hypothetical protein